MKKAEGTENKVEAEKLKGKVKKTKEKKFLKKL